MIEFSVILSTVGAAFIDWLRMFAAPLKNLEMLWIIIPIWCAWIFSEFFQEKKGTSFGNAITNGAVMLFVGIDWAKHIMHQINAGSLSLGSEAIAKLSIAAVIIVFGLFIVYLGIRARSFVRVIGRVRETTYLTLMFSPIVYGVVDFSLHNLIIILFFFPVFYLMVEILDKVLPTPKTFKVEEEESLEKSFGKELKEEFKVPELDGDFDNFPQEPYTSQEEFNQQRRRMF